MKKKIFDALIRFKIYLLVKKSRLYWAFYLNSFFIIGLDLLRWTIFKERVLQLTLPLNLLIFLLECILLYFNLLLTAFILMGNDDDDRGWDNKENPQEPGPDLNPTKKLIEEVINKSRETPALR